MKKIDHNKNLKIIFYISVILILFWIILEFLYIYYGVNIIDIFRQIPLFTETIKSFIKEISSRNLLAIYLLFSVTSIFIFPLPYDIIFVGFLSETEYPFKLLIFTFLGLLTGQNLNYFLGKYFGNKLMKKIKKKSKEWIENSLHKYEIYAIVFFNLLPLPYPLLNFIVGLTKFKYSKWLMLASITIFVRMSALAIFFS